MAESVYLSVCGSFARDALLDQEVCPCYFDPLLTGVLD